MYASEPIVVNFPFPLQPCMDTEDNKYALTFYMQTIMRLQRQLN